MKGKEDFLINLLPVIRKVRVLRVCLAVMLSPSSLLLHASMIGVFCVSSAVIPSSFSFHVLYVHARLVTFLCLFGYCSLVLTALYAKIVEVLHSLQ